MPPTNRSPPAASCASIEPRPRGTRPLPSPNGRVGRSPRRHGKRPGGRRDPGSAPTTSRARARSGSLIRSIDARRRHGSSASARRARDFGRQPGFLPDGPPAEPAPGHRRSRGRFPSRREHRRYGAAGVAHPAHRSATGRRDARETVPLTVDRRAIASGARRPRPLPPRRVPIRAACDPDPPRPGPQGRLRARRLPVAAVVRARSCNERVRARRSPAGALPRGKARGLRPARRRPGGVGRAPAESPTDTSPRNAGAGSASARARERRGQEMPARGRAQRTPQPGPARSAVTPASGSPARPQPGAKNAPADLTAGAARVWSGRGLWSPAWPWPAPWPPAPPRAWPRASAGRSARARRAGAGRTPGRRSWPSWPRRS